MRMPRSAAWQRTASVCAASAPSPIAVKRSSSTPAPRPPHARLDGGGTVERLEGVDDPLGRWPRALVIHHWHLLVVDLPWNLTHAHRQRPGSGAFCQKRPGPPDCLEGLGRLLPAY